MRKQVLHLHGIVERDAGCFGPEAEGKAYDDAMHAALYARLGEHVWDDFRRETEFRLKSESAREPVAASDVSLPQ